MRLLNIPKAAKALGLSRQRVHVLVQSGQIRRDSGSGLISATELARFKRTKRLNGRPKGKRDSKPRKRKS